MPLLRKVCKQEQVSIRTIHFLLHIDIHFTGGTLSQEQIRVILWWQQGSRKKIQTSLSSARSHVQLYKIGSCQINDDKVSIVHFHVLMSFYSIYAILSQIRFCRDLHFFFINFWGQKLRLRKFLDKYDVCENMKWNAKLELDVKWPDEEWTGKSEDENWSGKWKVGVGN